MSAGVGARSAILARLRAATISAPVAEPQVQPWFDAHRRNEVLAQRISRLREAMQAVHTEVHDSTPQAWPELLRSIAAQKKLRSLLIGGGTAHGETLQAGADESLLLRRYDQAIDSWRDALFDEVDASLTLAKSAIAETGSLILWPTRAEPRLMSLVPPVHFVLLDVETIHANLNDAMRAERWSEGLPTNALLISGPSKTADIQQTLAYGAHGPRELVLLLLHGEGAAS